MTKPKMTDIKPAASGLPVGPNKGYRVTKKPIPLRRVATKGHSNPRVKLVREVIREISGFAPYERRIMELLKIGSASCSKRALKLAKRRLGTHNRGKRKREELQNVLIQQRKRAAAAAAAQQSS